MESMVSNASQKSKNEDMRSDLKDDNNRSEEFVFNSSPNAVRRHRNDREIGCVPPLNLSTGRQFSQTFEDFHSSPIANLPVVSTKSGVRLFGENDAFHLTPGPSSLCMNFNCNRLVPNPDRVFVWYLDETTIILNSLLNGEFAKKFGKDIPSCISLGLAMEKMIGRLADERLFYSELEGFNQMNLEDSNSNEFAFAIDGLLSSAYNNSSADLTSAESACYQRQDKAEKLVQKFRQIRENFNSNRTNVGALLGSERKKSWLRLRSEIESLTDHWTSLAVKTLAIIGERASCANVLVSADPLIIAISKVLLYGLGGSFRIENIYSSAGVGKEVSFKRIFSRFGDKCTYIVVGQDDELTAKQMCWPFWRISSHADIAALYHALNLGYL